MLGEQFMVGEEICGAVVSVRFQVSPRGQVWFHMLPFLGPSPRRALMSPLPLL